jgi:hypothetical protein
MNSDTEDVTNDSEKEPKNLDTEKNSDNKSNSKVPFLSNKNDSTNLDEDAENNMQKLTYVKDTPEPVKNISHRVPTEKQKDQEKYLEIKQKFQFPSEQNNQNHKLSNDNQQDDEMNEAHDNDDDGSQADDDNELFSILKPELVKKNLT